MRIPKIINSHHTLTQAIQFKTENSTLSEKSKEKIQQKLRDLLAQEQSPQTVFEIAKANITLNRCSAGSTKEALKMIMRKKVEVTLNKDLMQLCNNKYKSAHFTSGLKKQLDGFATICHEREPHKLYYQLENLIFFLDSYVLSDSLEDIKILCKESIKANPLSKNTQTSPVAVHAAATTANAYIRRILQESQVYITKTPPPSPRNSRVSFSVQQHSRSEPNLYHLTNLP